MAHHTSDDCHDGCAPVTMVTMDTSGLGDKIDDRGFQAIDAEAAHEAWRNMKQEAT